MPTPRRTPQTSSPQKMVGNNGGTVPKIPTKANAPQLFQEDGKATAGYSIEITKSLGNYEFLKIRASVELPHGADQKMIDEMDDLVKVAKELVIKRIEEDMDTLDFQK